MLKKILSLFVSFLLIFCFVIPATAAKAETFEDTVNAMKLEPLCPSYWDKAFVKRIDTLIKGKKDNYSKMLAIYNDLVKDAGYNKKAYNSKFHAIQLQCAFEILGFRTYTINGVNKYEDYDRDYSDDPAQNGDAYWVGVDIGNYLYYFNAFLPAYHGVEAKKCFAIPYNDTSLLKSAMIWQKEIAPITRTQNSSLISEMIVIDWTKGIPNSVSKRKPYRAVFDVVYSRYYDKGGNYWVYWETDGTPILVTDRNGVEITCYPDGTRETKEEGKAKSKKEQEERQAERVKQALEERASNQRASVRKHRHRNPDGTYGEWHDGERDDCTAA